MNLSFDSAISKPAYSSRFSESCLCAPRPSTARSPPRSDSCTALSAAKSCSGMCRSTASLSISRSVCAGIASASVVSTCPSSHICHFRRMIRLYANSVFGSSPSLTAQQVSHQQRLLFLRYIRQPLPQRRHLRLLLSPLSHVLAPFENDPSPIFASCSSPQELARPDLLCSQSYDHGKNQAHQPIKVATGQLLEKGSARKAARARGVNAGVVTYSACDCHTASRASPGVTITTGPSESSA